MNRLNAILLSALVVLLAVTSGCDNQTESEVQADTQPVTGKLANPARDRTMIATARYAIPIDQQGVPAPIPRVVNSDLRPTRNYPMQPPLIPHDIRGYEVNLQVNTCMACHARSEVTDTQATMISVTHYMDRQGNFLASISPRRYFCNQCHVVQTASNNIVDNNFEDMDTLIRELAEAEAN